MKTEKFLTISPEELFEIEGGGAEERKEAGKAVGKVIGAVLGTVAIGVSSPGLLLMLWHDAVTS
ncbi:MAG: hypothetical protein R8G66_06300 [Cytophagales bacterium]|nr:hypothetical protein [Cytophagales bacterium]